MFLIIFYMSIEMNHFRTKKFPVLPGHRADEEILEYTEWGINFQNVQSGLTHSTKINCGGRSMYLD